MIGDFYNTSFTIKRASWTTDVDGNPYSTEATTTIFSGHIQQADPELVQNLGLTLSKTFSVWCPLSTAVLESDTIVAGANTYSVKAVMEYANGNNAHKELIVQKDDV